MFVPRSPVDSLTKQSLMPWKGNINRLVCFDNGKIQRKWPYIFSIDVTGKGYLTHVKQSATIIEFSIFS